MSFTSDFRTVGYATPWIRPPVEVYSGMMYHSFDGAQVVYRQSLGAFNLTVQPSVGKSKAEVRTQTQMPGLGRTDIDIRFDADTIYGVNMLLEYNDWTARWGTVRSDATADVYGRLPVVGWRQLASGSKFKDNFSGFGLQYDNGKLLVMSEYVTRRSAQTNTDGYYITGVYRIGNWAPYLTVAGFKEQIGGITTSKSNSQTVGLRWNAAKNLSLKTQLDFVEPDAGAFVPPIPAKRARVLSVAMDFVF